MGWFTEPARRTMLTATTTPGDYPSAYVINRERYYTRLNQIDNYADAKDLVVRVTNIEGKPMIGATVRYLLYNYAEFYPLATLKTNSLGLSHLQLGLGDILIWAGDDEKFAFRKVSVADADTVSLVLLKRPFDEYTDDMDFVPPAAKSPLIVSQGARDVNNKRLAYEDSLRGAYESTFMNQERAAAFIAGSNAKDVDKVTKADLIKFLVSSRGNHKELCRVINEPDVTSWAADILRVISEKDLRDCEADILLSHIRHTAEPLVKNAPYSSNSTTFSFSDHQIWSQYLLNPRIGIEMLTPYKEQLRSLFPEKFWQDVLQNPRVAGNLGER